MTKAVQLVDANADLWAHIVTHPFVVAAADGSLDPVAFDRWVVEDHAFVAGFRRFLSGLIEIAPDEAARDVLSRSLAPLQAELDLFRSEAAARGLELGAEPSPTTLGYTSFLIASLADGYDTALTVLYGAEKAYFDAWTAVRSGADRHSPYLSFIDNWASDAFGDWVSDIAQLLERVQPAFDAFARVVRFELRFWDAVYAGDTW